jgi:hypothetical protein
MQKFYMLLTGGSSKMTINKYKWHFGYVPKWVRDYFKDYGIGYNRSGCPFVGVITEKGKKVRGKHYEYMAVIVADSFSLCNSEDSIVKRKLRR